MAIELGDSRGVESRGVVEYNVTEHTVVPPRLRIAALAAAEKVWARLMGTPTTINVEFFDALTGRLRNETLPVKGCYHEASDTVALAVSPAVGAPPVSEQDMAQTAAHEVTHRAQLLRGETLTPSIPVIL